MSLTPNYSHHSLHCPSITYLLRFKCFSVCKISTFWPKHFILYSHSLIPLPLHPDHHDLLENCSVFFKNVTPLTPGAQPKISSYLTSTSFFLALWLCHVCPSKPQQQITSNHSDLLPLHTGYWCSCWKASIREDWCHYKCRDSNSSCSVDLHAQQFLGVPFIISHCHFSKLSPFSTGF